MAPKRRRDAVAREIAKTYTFGRSQIEKTDVESLVKNLKDRYGEPERGGVNGSR
jgi:hypothetical protein